MDDLRSLHAASIALLLWASGSSAAAAQWPQIAVSKDGTPISFESSGAGEPTLVFVHGWSCDSRYWRAQVDRFSAKHRVVTLDLAGHGHSGASRARYTMRGFGEDVQAVVDSVGISSAILIGHSMGGPVVAEAARLLPGKVVGLIGVDTFDSIEYPLTAEELEKMVRPLEEDFGSGARRFVEPMLSTRTDAKLREWILSDMAAAPPAVAVSALRELLSQNVTGRAARVFDDIPVPVLAVSGDLWPVDIRANRRHMASFDAIVLKDADHFLMLDRPEEFNAALEKAIESLPGRPHR